MEKSSPEIDFIEEHLKDLQRVYFETNNNPKLKEELHKKIYDYQKALFTLKYNLKKKSLV